MKFRKFDRHLEFMFRYVCYNDIQFCSRPKYRGKNGRPPVNDRESCACVVCVVRGVFGDLGLAVAEQWSLVRVRGENGKMNAKIEQYKGRRVKISFCFES